MLTTKLVTTDKEITRIAALSAANQVDNISTATKAKEGFVTWIYNPDILQTLHAIAPSVIVMDGDILAGYAITLTPECLDAYPPAKPTFEHANTLTYKEKPVNTQKFYLMGQICVAEAYRGQGVVGKLYAGHRQFYSDHYHLLITEISTANPRSMKAHQKVGFETIDLHHENGSDWAVVCWDWT